MLWRLLGFLCADIAAILEEVKSPISLLEATEKRLRALRAPQRLIIVVRDYQRDQLKYQQQAHKDSACLRDMGAHLVTWFDSCYPSRLKEIAKPPVALCVQGSIELLNAPQLAIVGSRKATPTGLEIAFDLALQLADAGLVIVSGMAHGIDAAAHRGALQASHGGTIAVLGTGLDLVYPKTHRSLRDQIGVQGLLVSEFMPSAPPLAHHFPRRNRVISGMSMGVLVIEAAERSGSLITARLARECNREVFAVPGSIYNVQSSGCHQLLRSGAKLVAMPEDVLEELAAQFKPIATTHKEDKPTIRVPKDMSEDLRLLLRAVGFEPTSVDLAIARTQLDPATVAAGIATLELKGLIKYTEAGLVRTGSVRV